MEGQHKENIPSAVSQQQPRNNHHGGFTFPTSLQPTFKFLNADYIFCFLRQEAQRLQLLIEPKTYFQLKQLPRKRAPRSLTLACRICRNGLYFRRQGKHWVAIRIESFHSHPVEMTRREWKVMQRHTFMTIFDEISQECDFTQRDLIDDMDSIDDDYEVKAQSPDSNSEYISPLNSFQHTTSNQTTNEKPLILPYIIMRDTDYISNHPLVQEGQRFFQSYPNFKYIFEKELIVNEKSDGVLLFVTPEMCANYKRFCDLLSFEFYQDCIRGLGQNNFACCIFTVNDTNLRPLIVGVGIFSKPTRPNISFRLLTEFLKMHDGNFPRSLLINHNPNLMNLTVDMFLKRYGVTLNYVLNPVWMLRTLGKVNPSKLTERQHAEFMEKVKLAMNTRNMGVYNSLVDEFLKQNTFTFKFFDLIKPAFYCGTDHYVGLLPDNTKTYQKEFQAWSVKHRPHMFHFLQRVLKLSQEFNHNSLNQWLECTEDIESFMGEPRLRFLRNNHEDKVFRRFIENIVDGAEHCVCTVDRVELKVMKNSTTNQHFIIKKWKCQCGEFERTGVGCSHVAYLAMSEPEADLSQLIDKRWRRARPNDK